MTTTVVAASRAAGPTPERYRPVTNRVQRDVAQRIGGLIWEAAKAPEDGGSDTS